MLAPLRALSVVVLALAATSCSNALYFYETGKISLTIEGRPDSTQPVQGNLGFKQRTAVVVPPKAAEGGGTTDSGAMISSFRFGNRTDSGIDIRTALVTGLAASCLSEDQTTKAAKVVADAAPIPTYSELAKSSINTARAGQNLGRLEALAQRPYAELTSEEVTELGRITGVGDNYNVKLHDAIADALGG